MKFAAITTATTPISSVAIWDNRMICLSEAVGKTYRCRISLTTLPDAAIRQLSAVDMMAEKYDAITIPVTPTGRISRISIGMAISASASGNTTRAHIPRKTPVNAITGYSKRPAMNQAFFASRSFLQAYIRW